MARPIDFYFRAPAPVAPESSQDPQIVSELPKSLQLPQVVSESEQFSNEEEETTEEFIKRIVPQDTREEVWDPLLLPGEYDEIIHWLDVGHEPYLKFVVKGVTCEQTLALIAQKKPKVVKVELWRMFFFLYFAHAEEVVIRESFKPKPEFVETIIGLSLPYAKAGVHINVAYKQVDKKRPKTISKARFIRFLRGTYAYIEMVKTGRPLPETLLTLFPEPS